MNTAPLILLIAAVLAALILLLTYNRLVTERNRFRNAFAQIDVQLKRRYELIPNLVETARGYLKHERETLKAVIRARNAAVSGTMTAAARPGDATAMRGMIDAESALASALGQFRVLAEAYPELKANQTMLQLMEELTSTENRIAFARQAYNDAVLQYNIARERFPNMLLAGPLGFAPAHLFELAGPREAEVPVVSVK